MYTRFNINTPTSSSNIAFKLLLQSYNTSLLPYALVVKAYDFYVTIVDGHPYTNHDIPTLLQIKDTILLNPINTKSFTNDNPQIYTVVE